MDKFRGTDIQLQNKIPHDMQFIPVDYPQSKAPTIINTCTDINIIASYI